MSTAVSAHCARPPRESRDVDSPSLRHWSEVPEEPPDKARPAQLTPAIASALRDLVAWAADLAIALTDGCPEDRAAIEQVRACAFAWLDAQPCPELEIHDVLVTAAALMSGIDLRLQRSTPNLDDVDRDAIGAASVA
jgi:hypothetical protein